MKKITIKTSEDYTAEIGKLKSQLAEKEATFFQQITAQDAEIERLGKKFEEEREAHESTMQGSLEINASWNEEKERRESLEARIAMLVEAIKSVHAWAKKWTKMGVSLNDVMMPLELHEALKATAPDVERWAAERGGKMKAENERLQEQNAVLVEALSNLITAFWELDEMEGPDATKGEYIDALKKHLAALRSGKKLLKATTGYIEKLEKAIGNHDIRVCADDKELHGSCEMCDALL